MTLTCGSWSEGQHDLYFMVQWFCLISWRLFNVWTSYFGIMSQDDTTFDLKINVGHCDLYFMVQWFCLRAWRLFHVRTSLCGIMSQYDPTLDLKINKGHWPIFHGPVILCYILKTSWASSWDYDTYHIGDQQRLRWACAVSLEPSLFTQWSMEIDEGSDEKPDI